MSGSSWLAFNLLFPIAAIAITLWMIYLGFRMWRMASRAMPLE
jgi:divalent metal cation (Fe/Co/Zn/Cd) transporter